MHRGQLEMASDLLASAGETLKKIDVVVAEHPDLRYTGYVDDT